MTSQSLERLLEFGAITGRWGFSLWGCVLGLLI